MFEIRFYKNEKGESEIEEWMERLAKEAQTSKDSRINLNKLYVYFGLLKEHGTRAGEPYMKYLEDGIWELRPVDNRVLFFYWENGKFVLLHYFRKKTQKTPKREIEKAKRNRDDFLRRMRWYHR